MLWALRHYHKPNGKALIIVSAMFVSNLTL